MRVGIYNRWLATLGGGEKYCLTIAECLSHRHEVEVLSHTLVSRKEAEERLHLDLSQVKFVTLTDRSAQEMTPVTAGYDFFVNSSYSDFFSSSSRYSANVVYFPTRIDAYASWRHKAKDKLRQFLCLPEVIIGPQSFNLGRDSESWFSDSDLKLRFPSRQAPYSVRFDLRSCNPAVQRAELILDGEIVDQVKFSGMEQPYSCQIQIPAFSEKKYHELLIMGKGNEIQVDGRPRIAISHLYLDLPVFRLYQRWLAGGLSKMGVNLEYGPANVRLLENLDTYSAIWAISEFSRSWIERYWHRPSEILYPPVDVERLSPGKKSLQILSVGRFFAGQHNKKHTVMINVFKEMVDQGLRGWTLQLAGGTTPGTEHQAYFEDIIEQARGYPIEILPDISFSRLADLYATSSIYWHASGYGEQETRHPEKYEHFGITTVEAMAAGCVPVVIAKGGQPEIVQHGINGFLWNNPKELERLTRQVINDESLRQTLSLQALKDNRKFSKDVFFHRLDELMRGYR